MSIIFKFTQILFPKGRFFTQKDVKRHLVVHTGVRNFPCPYCTQRFGRKDHLVRHAKKTHDQDTRSFKRRNRAANNSPSNVTETKKAKKSTSQRSRRKDGNFAAVQPNSTASIATVTSTSQSTSYYMHDNGYNSSDRVAATSNQSYNSDSTIMLTSTTSTSTLNSSFPKTVTLVDRPTTSTLTASSFTHSRNYPSFNHFEPSSTNFSYGTNSSFNPHHPHHHHHHHPFLSDNGNTQYPLQLTSNSIYLNYDYKPSGINYGCNSHQEEFSNASSRSVHLGIGPSSSSNVSSFKTITSSIVDGFNTCIDLEYNNTGMNPFNASSATVTIAAPHPPPPSQQQPPPPPKPGPPPPSSTRTTGRAQAHYLIYMYINIYNSFYIYHNTITGPSILN